MPLFASPRVWKASTSPVRLMAVTRWVIRASPRSLCLKVTTSPTTTASARTLRLMMRSPGAIDGSMLPLCSTSGRTPRTRPPMATTASATIAIMRAAEAPRRNDR
jgi:hypothetical protein